ncbi:hypothetical protein NDU88_012168 [Pleurodeles waltl]|uniref:Secreted protein n=1 Tax=Pleurodeles waltl TaxID=8319 RepID=A0AAV7R348_PLEWA|nr:hypothetical protein NDU88_012168 [Pleurodeles waltl]
MPPAPLPRLARADETPSAEPIFLRAVLCLLPLKSALITLTTVLQTCHCSENARQKTRNQISLESKHEIRGERTLCKMGKANWLPRKNK